MITSPKNRVQEIKNRFENLNNGTVQKSHDRANVPLNLRVEYKYKLVKEKCINNHELGLSSNEDKVGNESDSSEEGMPTPNASYLYGKNVNNFSVSESRSSLTRKISDPGKKLHRSHAFRCDKSQKIGGSPKRHGSCNGRSETSGFTLKMDKKLSQERRMMLGNFLEQQMKKENFIPKCASLQIVGQVSNVQHDSIHNSEVPQHILDQYATVNKPKQNEIEKHEAMTDSGVCSETENTDEDKNGRLKRLLSQFEKSVEATNKSNLDSMEFCDSSETIRLERKNPHLKLTDTLKKALKQPLPPGPPPQKPPRTFVTIPENIEIQKNETKRKLEKLEQVLKKREQTLQAPQVTMKKPKEIHYLCTEITDITNRTLLPSQNSDPLTRCLNSLNCAITNNSTSSLPYTRMMSEPYASKSPITMCCSCSNNSLDSQLKECTGCNAKSANDRFKCYLNSKCGVGKSEFYVKEQEHIYDEPYTDSDYLVGNKYSSRKNKYGTLNALKNCKSMDDLRPISKESRNIYNVVYEPFRIPTPEPSPMAEFEKLKPNFEESQTRLDFEKLRQNFEAGSVRNSIEDGRKIKPILMSKIRDGKSTESLSEEYKSARKNVEKKFAAELKRYKKGEGHIAFSLPKGDTQLDSDKENLNCLMNEIYDTVTAVCNMDDNKPGSFPTEHSDGSTSEDSVKLTRSLTEKRKNYVRRVSTRVAYLDPKNIKTARFRHQTSVCSFKFDNDNPYSTYRSWKSFRTSQGSLPKMERDDSKVNLTDSRGNILSMNDFDSSDSIDKLSIDEKAGCLDIKLPFEPRERGLFNLCVLVGLNYMTGQAYVKSVFPSQVPVPPHIENLVFPETMSEAPHTEWSALAASQQCYSLVLTDERGERSYGYCRRVLPECATSCLPLLYCLIGRYRAPGFYYKVLEEIETHHGISDLEIHSILQQLFETDFPDPGEEITIIYNTERLSTYAPSEDRSKTLPDMRRLEGAVNEVAEASSEAELTDYCDIENNNGKKVGVKRIKKIKRPIEPRADEDNLSVLLDLLGAGLVIKVFSCLLLERKVIIVGDRLRDVSSCVEALQSSLYPFVWQHTLISSIPAELHRELLEAPLPILAGMLHVGDQLSTQNFEEGMLIDLTHPSKVLFCHGDESTILPSPSFKTLKTSLKMETGRIRSEDTKTRNVMISEAFMRLFVDILGDFWRYFRVARTDEERELEKRDVVFDKDAFIKSTSSKENQFFLEWFTETAMFNHFIQNMSETYRHQLSKSQHPPKLVDTPLPNFYELFHERVRCRTTIITKNLDSSKNNYKNAVNKKIRSLKSKLRELVA